MTEQVHGHEIMEMMIASGKKYTREILEAEIIEKYGPETRFHTCSAENMTANELIDFLEQRGKFVSDGDQFSTQEENICNH